VTAARRAVARGLWLRDTLRRTGVPADGTRRGRALLSYIHTPLLHPGQAIPTSHTNFWESVQIARLLSELGYDVDVISYHNRWFSPRTDYDVVIDVRWNLERLAPLLPDDCVKILHCDTADTLSLVTAEHLRLLDLQQRRGVTLVPRRYERPHRGAQAADALTVLGNDVTLATYRYTGKPLHRVPVASAVEWPAPDGKDWDACRNRFLWLGSGGMVHKGLDRTLEAFAAMPDLHLTVCGPVDAEEDFVDAYRTELYETPNITTQGWVDVTSARFDEIVRSCSALVYPSSSEGCAGAVATCLQAGLIPITSRESGVDVSDEMGVVLATSSVEEIVAAVRRIADEPAPALAARAAASWEHARANHTRAAFTRRYRQILEELVG
jgi:glycosyltransferase involved in cell wall biosynthesis